jgi:D-lactate dehydrogenase
VTMEVSVYDTKPYDREYLSRAAAKAPLSFRFHEFRLNVETASAAKGTQGVCIFVNDRADRACLETLASLQVKLIALRCAGFNNVDVKAARELGIRIVRVPAYSPHAVAEHTIALLLALNRKIHRAHNRVRELNFSLSGLVGFDICGKTVGIIGTGKIGRIAAQIFRGFEADVIACDPFPNLEWASQHKVQYVEFDQLLQSSDILSLHLPLSTDSLHLLNEKSMARTKPGVFIVNTSRGKLIDTTALIAALKSGHIGGVALDVYEEEEGIFFQDLSGQVLLDDELSHLLIFPNVLITSHQAFLTNEALSEIARVTIANLQALETGEAFIEGTTLT